MKKVLLLMFAFVFVQTLISQDEYNFNYSKKSSQFQREYGINFSVKMSGINRLDYKYKTSFKAEQPSPDNPNPSRPGTNVNSNGSDCKLLQDELVRFFNELLEHRLSVFGQDKIDQWYKKLDSINENSQEIKKIHDVFLKKMDEKNTQLDDSIAKYSDELKQYKSDLAKETDPSKKATLNENIQKNTAAIYGNEQEKTKNNEIKNKVASFTADEVKKIKTKIKEFANPNDKGMEALSNEEILKSMLETKEGGAIIIAIEAQPKTWKIKKENDDYSITENDIKPEDLTNSDLPAVVLEHCEKRVLYFKFKGPKTVTVSTGPYVVKLPHHEFQKVLNPVYNEENPNGAPKYIIDYKEKSESGFGIATFWNAPAVFCWPKLDIGFSWGVAYTAQKTINTAINGLVAVYVKDSRSTVYFNIGCAFGYVAELAGGYVEKSGINEDVEIPTKMALKGGLFFSISFRL